MTVADADRDVDHIHLSAGVHAALEDGACVMELASYLAHEPWSDHPLCVSRCIGTFVRPWHDALDDETRQLLRPYAARLIGTNTGPEDDARRAWLATDWLVRTFAPAWLDLAGLGEQAAALRALPELNRDELVPAALRTIHAAEDAAWDAAWDAARYARDAAWDARDAEDAARAAARDARDAARAAAWYAAGAAARAAAEDAAGAAAGAAAWDAGRDAGRDAAWDAAGVAARAAAGVAARAATWDAAEAAAWDAARDAGRDAAEVAARAAARAAAEDAARAAAWDAAGVAARAAAGVAAGAALRPTVLTLQESAFRLLDRMIAVGRPEPAS